ncbi:DUF3857 domain-containing protein [Tenacibaculum amylolyticum]|uniref:DUF3857 domain-containing protein n=1 Tax=Tenacibaculum amylolyticum TaxID=104269 RepID=UPI0038945712
MKKLLFIVVITFTITKVFAQKNGKTPKLGQTTQEELKMAVYSKDSTANAVVLEEIGYTFVDKKNDYDFRTDIYKRVKIFNNNGYDQATIKIPLYKKERVKYIKAVTYNIENNNETKVFLLDSQVFTKSISENWKEVSFTLPNIKDGSVIEYRYSVISPYTSLDDWKFQTNIPKIKSDYTASIPGNWRYNIVLRSNRKLDRNESYKKRGCLYIGGIGEGDCAVVSYGMDHIPAFKSEDFMLSEENFKSKIIFELVSFTNTNGVTTKYTKTWKDADKTLKNNFFDQQTSKKSYFKKKLPQEILSITPQLEKAKEIYKHIQNKLSWNHKYWSREKIRVKQVYENNSGAVDGINLVLYNAMQAAGIESYLVTLSTRNNGQITKLHPSVSAFNYVLVKVILDGETYFLDATDKQLFFGEIPFKCLNGKARVIDFKKGSYWELLKPKFYSSERNNITLAFNEDGILSGNIISAKKGYPSLRTRRKLETKSTEEYLESFESNHPDLEVSHFEVISNTSEALKTSYQVEVPDFNMEGDIIKINPFVFDKYDKNPFKLKERNYPVDFGYAWANSYFITLKIPDGYIVSKTPENATLSLPEKSARLMFRVNKTDKEIKIYMKFNFKKAIYTNVEYHYLKEFFKKIIELQDTFIELKKK